MKLIEFLDLFCLLIWIFYTILSARFEAYYYNYASKDNSKDIKNLHILFTTIRTLVLLPIFILTTWKITICYIMLFPFFHDGAYYTKRHNIDNRIYKDKWLSQSTTSTAKLTKYFTPLVRVCLMLLALILLTLIHYKSL